MFIRPCYRTKDGKRHAYWALVESYRGKRGPRQRTVAYLGQLDQQERLGIRQAVQGDPQSYQRHLFDDVEPTDHQAVLLQRLGLYLPSHLPVAERKMKGM